MKRELWGKDERKTEFYSDGIIVNNFSRLEIQEISLAGKLTV